MTVHLGNVDAGSILYIPFMTFNSSAASVTITGLAVTDIEIYKDGSTTQRASDSGYALLDTDGIDFDGITGIHGFSIDLSDNTTSGFFAEGSFYWVVVSAITVDSQTVNFVPATFRIGPVSANITQLGGVTQSLTDLKDFADDGYDPSTNKVQGVVLVDSLTAVATGGITAGSIAADAIGASELAADAITEIQSGLATAAALDVVDNFLDTEVAAILAAVDTEVAAIKAVTDQFVFTNPGEVDANAVTGGGGSGLDAAGVRAAIGMASANLDTQLDALATQTSVDTLDNFLDTEVAAIKAKTDQLTFSTANVVDSSGVSAASIRSAIGLSSANLDTQLEALPTAAENAAAVFTTAMTESYATDGAAFTLAQGMYAIHQYLMGFEIATVNYSVLKLDGTTEAFVVTLNDAVEPTGAVR
jgi:hypothetical protein